MLTKLLLARTALYEKVTYKNSSSKVTSIKACIPALPNEAPASKKTYPRRQTRVHPSSPKQGARIKYCRERLTEIVFCLLFGPHILTAHAETIGTCEARDMRNERFPIEFNPSFTHYEWRPLGGLKHAKQETRETTDYQ